MFGETDGEEFSIDSDGVELVGFRHRQRRSENNPPLLIVHGHAGSAHDFDDHIEWLRQTRDVYKYWQRGHGRSGAPSELEKYSLEILASDLEAVSDFIGASRIDALGHSMGGVVLQHALIASPQRFNRVVLESTQCGPITSFDRELVEKGVDIALTKGIGQLKRALDEISPLGTPAHEKLLLEREGFREWLDQKWLAVSPHMWSAIVLELTSMANLAPKLVKVANPVMVLVGEQDRAFLVGSTELANALPNAERIVINDAGHSPHLEQPEVWRRRVGDFLDQPA